MKRTALICLLLLSVVAVAEPRIALRDGLIIDSEINVAYVMAVDGGIAAVDLGNGGFRWTSDKAAKPLSVLGNILLSQVEPKNLESTHKLEIARLDVQKRGESATQSAAPLPSTVRASVGETMEGTFVTDAQADDGHAIITWTFTPSARSEARARPPQVNRAEPIERRKIRDRPSGRFRLDLATGEMAPVLGNFIVAPQELWAFDAQKIKPAGKPQYKSADGRHVLESQRIADDRTWEKYRWVISVRKTGKRIGEVRSHVSFAPFVVRDSVLVFETTPYWRKGQDPQPAKLRGVSLENGRELWAIPVREIVRRAPTPP